MMKLAVSLLALGASAVLTGGPAAAEDEWHGCFYVVDGILSCPEGPAAPKPLPVPTPAAATTTSPTGTAAEARAMLEKAVAAVRANKYAAIALFNRGEGGFRDRDLYPFCFNVSDGLIVANEYDGVLGIDVRTLKDRQGTPFGQAIYDAATDDQIREVRYVWPQPGKEATLVPKVSFVTKVADLGCGVGYYSPP